MLKFKLECYTVGVRFDWYDHWADPWRHVLPWIGCARLPWWWWCLHFLKQQSLFLQFLLYRLAADLFLSQLGVLFLSLSFG